MARPLVAMLATSVEQGQDGRIGVLGGGISVLRLERLPASSERLGLLVAIEGDGREHEDHGFHASLFDPLGKDMLDLRGELHLERSGPLPYDDAGPFWINLVLPAVTFALPGRYRLVVRLGEAEVTLPLAVEGVLVYDESPGSPRPS